MAPKVLASWRQRAAVESPSHLRRRALAAAVTLLSALLVQLEREVTDALVDLPSPRCTGSAPARSRR